MSTSIDLKQSVEIYLHELELLHNVNFVTSIPNIPDLYHRQCPDFQVPYRIPNTYNKTNSSRMGSSDATSNRGTSSDQKYHTCNHFNRLPSLELSSSGHSFRNTVSQQASDRSNHKRDKFHKFCLNSSNDEWFEKEGLFYTKPQNEYGSEREYVSLKEYDSEQLDIKMCSPLNINNIFVSATSQGSPPLSNPMKPMTTIEFLAATPTASSKARVNAVAQHLLDKGGHSSSHCKPNRNLNKSNKEVSPLLQTTTRKEKEVNNANYETHSMIQIQEKQMMNSDSKCDKKYTAIPLDSNKIQPGTQCRKNYKSENIVMGNSTPRDMTDREVKGAQDNENGQNTLNLLKKYECNIKMTFPPLMKISKKKPKESETELLGTDDDVKSSDDTYGDSRSPNRRINGEAVGGSASTYGKADHFEDGFSIERTMGEDIVYSEDILSPTRKLHLAGE